MDRSTLKQELEKVIGDSIETMNSKVQDGEENFEGDKNDIFPVALMRQEERARQRKMKIFLNGVGVAEIVMGVLALILNTIFIYDGMNSGWYSDQQEEGNGMKVISIGEGILAGVFCVDMKDCLFVNQNISRSYKKQALFQEICQCLKNCDLFLSLWRNFGDFQKISTCIRNTS